MLTLEILSQSSVLSGLTQEQFAAIASMSQNDETATLAKALAEERTRVASVVSQFSGARNIGSDEPFNDYIKHVVGGNATKLKEYNELKQKLEASEKQVAELNEKIKSGAADEALKTQLNDAKAQVTSLQTQLEKTKADATAAADKYASEMQAVKVGHAFDNATSGLKFKDGITEQVQRTLLNAAKAEILAKGTPEFQTTPDGQQKLVFRGQDGNVLLNPKTNLNPYTISELLMETSVKDVIATKVDQGGSGGNGGGGNGGGNTTVDISSAKSQIEADTLIEKQLLADGLTRDSPEFFTKFNEIRNESKVESLPIR